MKIPNLVLPKFDPNQCPNQQCSHPSSHYLLPSNNNSSQTIWVCLKTGYPKFGWIIIILSDGTTGRAHPILIILLLIYIYIYPIIYPHKTAINPLGAQIPSLASMLVRHPCIALQPHRCPLRVTRLCRGRPHCGKNLKRHHCCRIGAFTKFTYHRRELSSQTSDNMDKWESRGGKSQKRERKKKEDQRRERIRRKKMQVREKVKSRNTVFFQCFVAPEGRKIGSLKRWSAERSKIARRCGAKHILK